MFMFASSVFISINSLTFVQLKQYFKNLYITQISELLDPACISIGNRCFLAEESCARYR